MSNLYILNENGDPVVCEDLIAWAKWFERPGLRMVALDEIGDVAVSTVFLGLNYAFSGGPPVLWETMIFGGEHDEYQERYTNRQDALTGHAKAVAMVKP